MSGALHVALGALAIGLALHGLGRAAAYVAGERDAPGEGAAPVPLAIAWGLAVHLGLGGWLAAAGLFDRTAQRGLVLAGIALGVPWMLPRVRAAIERARGWRPTAGTVVTVCITAAVAVHTLGEAGRRHAAFLDLDGDVLAAAVRLDADGTLPDAEAYPRTAGLGGNVVATTLTTVVGDPATAHAIDGGLGLALLLALLFDLRRGPARAYAGFAVGALALGLPSLVPDLAPRWTMAALAVATLPAARRSPALAVLTAAGAATLGHGGLGLLAVLLVAASRTAASRTITPRMVMPRTSAARWRPFAIAAAVLGGYVVAYLRARTSLAAPPLVAPGLLVRLAIALPAAAILWALLSTLAPRGHGDDADAPALARFLAAAAAAIAAALVLAMSPTAGAIAAAPFLLAALLVLVVVALDELATLSPAAIALVVLVALGLGGLRFRTGLPPQSSAERAAHLVDRARAHGADTSPPAIDPAPASTAARACRALRGAPLALLRPAPATCRRLRAPASAP